MKTVIAYGIDFGTSNSSLAAAYQDGTTEVLVVDRGSATALRSLIFLSRDGNQLAGADAVRAYLTTGSARTRCGACELVDRMPNGVFSDCRQYQAGSGCQDSRLLAQIKADLATDAFDSTHSWATDFSFSELVAVILRRLKRSADRITGQDVRHVAIGKPVRFPGVEADPLRLQALAEERLRAAAELAGFDFVALMPEPQAAVTLEGIDDGLVVCTDFGGGTFDVAVLEKVRQRGDVLALGGVAVGGEAFDSRIFDLKMGDALGLDRTITTADGEVVGLPNWIRHQFRSLAGLKQLLTDNHVAVILRDIAHRQGGDFAESLSELLYGGQAYACYQAIEEAKIALSDVETTRIRLRRPPHIDIDVSLDRSELEALIAPDLALVRRCIDDALFDARVLAEDVTYVTRTGGSSRIPAYIELLGEVFGADRVVERDAFTTVVTGLAAYAYAEWAPARST
jgi:hypothetical chaperone protein